MLQRVGRGHIERVQLGNLQEELRDSSVSDGIQSAVLTSLKPKQLDLFPISLRAYSKSLRSGVALRSLACEVATRTWADASTNTPVSWRPTFHQHQQQPAGAVGAEACHPVTNTIALTSPSRSSLASPIPKLERSSLPQLTTPHRLRPLRLADKMADSPFRSIPYRIDTATSRHSSHYINTPPPAGGKKGSIPKAALRDASPSRSKTKKKSD